MQIDVLPFDDETGLDAAIDGLAARPRPPAFVMLHYDARIDVGARKARLAEFTLAMGGTSCRGVMCAPGLAAGGTAGGMLFAIDDPEGSYGAAIAPHDDDAQAAAAQATRAAMAQAGRPGEMPALIWVYGTPGEEERTIAGIESVAGQGVPIIGGSAADNDVAGGWRVFAGETRADRAIAVGALYPSGEVSLAYQNGYAPTGESGVVTAVDGRRVLEIDGRPAAAVYGEWTGGAVTTAPMADGSPRGILSESAFWPLGREMHEVAGVPFYLLAHPAAADAAGHLHLFADIAPGERLTQMRGTVAGLTSRAGRVADLARRAGEIPPAEVAGALMVYCGGCRMSVEDHLSDVVSGMAEALPGAPFAGVFTFGEQGPILSSGNRHGNLMVSCVVFSR